LARFLEWPGGISILMFSFRRTVPLLVLFVAASLGAQAQSSSSQAGQPAAPQQPSASTPNQASLSVQARIRARREQRRAAAIHDVYSHLYDAYFGAGFDRSIPGPGAVAGKGLQHFNLYSWNFGVARYYSDRLGVDVDARGSYGTAYIGNNFYNQNHPAISQYSGMIGPTYRFLLHPKYSVSGRVLGGVAYGNFSGDTDQYGTKLLGLYPDGAAASVSAGVPFEYNVSPGLGVRLVPEYRLTTFGSTTQNGWGLTGGVVARWGKQ
jgi:hypothetical protein